MVITIKKVYLRNFVSHKETEVTFDRGVTVLVGPNGAGKSSIVEAIYFAITGDVLRGEGRGKRKDVIINNIAKASEAVVKLWLDVDGEEVVIERRQSRLRKAFTDTIIKVGNKIYMSTNEVKRVITELFGLPESVLREVIRTIAIVPQGEISKLLTLIPSKRKELVDELLGLEAYKRAYERVDKIEIKVRLKTQGVRIFSIKKSSLDEIRHTYEFLISKLRDYEVELNKDKNEISNLKKKLSELLPKENELRSKVNHLRSEEERLSKLLGRRDELIKSKQLLSNDIKKLRERIDNLRLRLDEVKKMKERLNSIKVLAKLYEDASRLSNIESLIKDKQALINEKSERLKNLKHSLERLTELRSRYGELIERVTKEGMSEVLEDVDRELELIEKTLKEKEEVLEKVKEELVSK
ncbi:MAG: hypothetical protein DRO18_04895, partial [Thermoprotei archaeon]